MADKSENKRTGAKAQRPKDQATVDKWFGTEDACTTQTGWEPDEETKK
jgi:hypothetical protein